jgi:hypothetical protein
VSERRYQAILEVIGEGRTVSEVAAQWRVSRQTVTRGWPGTSWRTGGPVAPTGELPPPDVGRGRGDGARAAAITSVLGDALRRLSGRDRQPEERRPGAE